MAQSAVAFGQITITDITDIGTLSVYPTSNQPITVIYNPDQNTYTPNWGNSNLVLSPVIYYGGAELTAASTGVTILWKRQVGSGEESTIITGEAIQTDGSLKVSSNMFSETSSMLSYIVTVTYEEPESKITLTAKGKITFSLVKQASLVKTCSIEGKTIFKYNTSQSLVGGSSIVLTANLSNVTISKWQYEKSDGTWATYPNSGNSSTLTVNASDSTFNDDRCVVKLVTSDASVYDIHTITKLRDGAPGNSTIAAVLTNEDQMIPCNSSGTPTSYEGCETQIMIYRGGTVETSSWTIATAGTNVTYQVSADGTTWVSSTSSGSYPYVKIIGITADTGKVTFTCTKSGETKIVKTFSLIKMKTGANGTNATIYTIDAAAVAVNRNIGGTFKPSSVVVTAYSKTGSSNRAEYTGRFVIKDGAGTAIYTSTSNQSSYTITSDNLTAAAASGSLVVQLFKKDTTTGDANILDTQTIVITNDGATGAQGPQGNAGVDATNVILGNQADVIPCTNDNKTSAQLTITIPFAGYKGTSKVSCTVATPAKLFGITGSVTPATSTTDGKIIYSIPAGTSVTSASGVISLTFTCNSKTVVMEYRWTRSTAAKNGTNGIDAVVMQIATPSGNVFANGVGSLSAKATVYKGTTDVTSSANFQWAKFSGSAYTNISGATNSSITIQGSDVESFAAYQCTATYDGKNYIQYVSFIDITDPIQITVLSTLGEQIVNSSGVGAYYVLVYRNGEEIDTLKSDRFLEAAPPNPTSGDFYYHLDSTNKTATLKKYNGSAWVDASESDLPQASYEWTHFQKDGKTIATGPETFGKVIYMDHSFVNKKLISICKVTA